MKKAIYSVTNQFLKRRAIVPKKAPELKFASTETGCLAYVLKNAQKGNPQSVINAIDEFCSTYWMMNLGPDKAIVLKQLVFLKYEPKTIVELGGYCGYSALNFAYMSPKDSLVYTVEIQKQFIEISKAIIEFAGLSHKVRYFPGNTKQNQQHLKALGKIDLLFIDHQKSVYLSDFKIIEKLGVLGTGSLVVADNLIYPGSPDYHQYMKTNQAYESVLVQSYLEYTSQPDALLISKKI